MKLLKREEYEFYLAARVALRYRHEPTAKGHMDAAERAWNAMVKADVQRRRQIESEDEAA